jgi:hypothetical protein
MIKEMIYKGNIGMMEVVAFLKKANEQQKKEFYKHIDQKRNREAWDVLERTLGIKLER